MTRSHWKFYSHLQKTVIVACKSSQDHEISTMSVLNILKRNKFYPRKMVRTSSCVE